MYRCIGHCSKLICACAMDENVKRIGHCESHEIHRWLKEFFGHEMLDVSIVHYWVRVAKKKSVKLFDSPRPEHPKMAQTEELKRKINDQIQKNRGKTKWQLAAKAGNQSGNHSQTNWRTGLKRPTCQVGAKIADCWNKEKQKGNVPATFGPVLEWRWGYFEESHIRR